MGGGVGRQGMDGWETERAGPAQLAAGFTPAPRRAERREMRGRAIACVKKKELPPVGYLLARLGSNRSDKGLSAED